MYLVRQVDPDDSCRHECRILGRQGCFWPLPTFQIVAADTLAPIDAKSATGAWSGVLVRINAAIKARLVHCLEICNLSFARICISIMVMQELTIGYRLILVHD